MGHRVELQPGGSTFTVAPGETILQAAERRGIRLRYGCRHGKCSACKYLLLDGEVDFGDASVYSLTEPEREEGWMLVCCAAPLQDVVVRDDTEPDPRALPMITPQTYRTVVRAVEPIGGGMVRLEIARPDGLAFHAGQFVELSLPTAAGAPGDGRRSAGIHDDSASNHDSAGNHDSSMGNHDSSAGIHDGEWRAYSLASPPERERSMEFVVKVIPTGAFSGQLTPQIVGSDIGVRGPFGDAYLRSGDRDVLMVATGSGIAPVLSMLLHAAEVGDRRRFTVFHGVRDETGAAVADVLERQQDRCRIELVRCISRPQRADFGAGYAGRVTPAVQRQVGDASQLDAYLCGEPDMCSAVARLLEAKGLQEGCLFTDEFVPAGDGVLEPEPAMSNIGGGSEAL